MTLSETIEMCMLTGVTISFSTELKDNSYQIKVSKASREKAHQLTQDSYSEEAVVMVIKRMLSNL